MSSRNDKPGKPLFRPANYEVGFGKPPRASRFKKGQSGNPRGRPKGSRNRLPAMHEERMKDVILDEAYRGIAVQDGDRKFTVPMVQAVMRSIAVNAAKGNWRCQRLFAELLASTEGSRKALNDQWLETAIEYKVEWERELRRREVLGIQHLPEPLPHPDHVRIDLDEGTARVVGPRTKQEKEVFDEVMARRGELVDDLKKIQEARELTTDPEELSQLDAEWNDLLNLIGALNKLAIGEEMSET